jgi:hypothetical protein
VEESSEDVVNHAWFRRCSGLYLSILCKRSAKSSDSASVSLTPRRSKIPNSTFLVSAHLQTLQRESFRTIVVPSIIKRMHGLVRLFFLFSIALFVNAVGTSKFTAETFVIRAIDYDFDCEGGIFGISIFTKLTGGSVAIILDPP